MVYIHPVTLALCLHTTSPLPHAHHPNNKHTTITRPWPIRLHPPMALLWQRPQKPSCIHHESSLCHRSIPCCVTIFLWPIIESRRLQTTTSGCDFPPEQSSIILSKFMFILSFHIKNALVHCLLTLPPPNSSCRIWIISAATARNKQQNTSV